MACEAHGSLVSDITRIRDDMDDLYEKSRDHEGRIVALEERDKRRASDATRMETAIEKLEKIVHDLAEAPAKKIAARWDAVLLAALCSMATGGLGVLTTLLVLASKGGKP